MTKLRLATREQDTFEKAFAAQISAYRTLRPDVEVEVITSPIHDHMTRYAMNNQGETDQIDILLCCTDWIPDLVASGRALTLDDFLAAKPPADWGTGWHPAMLGLQQVDGKTYGLPWHDGPEVFHTRRDLFESPAEQERYLAQTGKPLRIPETWDEFLAVAQFFTRPEEGLWGCCEAAYTDGHNNVYDFLIHLWSRGGTLFDEQWRPQFHGPAGVEGLQFYADLFHKHRVAPLECLTLGSVECGDFYAAGNAAMMWNWCGFAAVCEMPEYSQIVGKNRCTKLPRGTESVSLNIYWVLTILSHTPHAQEAYDFLHFLATPECDKITSLCGANGVRLSTWRDPEILAQYPYYSIIEEVHAGTRTLPAIPEFTTLNEFLSTAVHEVVHEHRDPETALREAAANCEDFLRQSGRIA